MLRCKHAEAHERFQFYYDINNVERREYTMAHSFKHRRGEDGHDFAEVELRKDRDRQRRERRREASETEFMKSGFEDMLAEAGIQ